MYGSQSTLTSIQSSQFGDYSDDEDADALVDRFGFVTKDGAGPPDLHTTNQKNRDREMKWIKMLADWNKYSRSKKHMHIMKNRARKGIPDALRGRAWMFLSGGEILKQASLQGKILDESGEAITFVKLDGQKCPEDWKETIEKDLHRQFPEHEMFRKTGNGKQDLYRVLKAWVLYKPEVGYCQGQAPVASLLLMNLTAEDAFWSLVSICEHFIPGYYDEGLTAIQIDGLVLQGLLEKYNKRAYNMMTKNGVEPILYMTEWFMCCFIRSLPWQTVLRIFDIFLAEGVKVLFRVGLTLIQENLANKKLNDMAEIMQALKHQPGLVHDETKFVYEVSKQKISEQELAKEFEKQKKKWDEAGRGPVRRNYYRRLPESYQSQINITNVKGKPSHWSYNPINADVSILTGKTIKHKMEPIKESDDDPGGNVASNWQGVSHTDPVAKPKLNTNNSACQTENVASHSADDRIITHSDDEVIETDL